LELAALRIDKLMWHLRLAKSRSAAQALIAQGHVRINGKRVEKVSMEGKVGDVITLPRGEDALVVRVLAIPAHRGSASEAREFYAEI
jgi:ribosome-associated heat shock protein Hsp15